MLIEGVLKLVPVPRDEPPDEAANQLIVTAEAVAPRLTTPVPHLEPSDTELIVGLLPIDAVTVVLLAVVHPLAVAST